MFLFHRIENKRSNGHASDHLESFGTPIMRSRTTACQVCKQVIKILDEEFHVFFSRPDVLYLCVLGRKEGLCTAREGFKGCLDSFSS